VFVLVKSVADRQLRFTITAYKRDLAIELVEGHNYQFNLEHVRGSAESSGFMHFFFKPGSETEDINILVHSLFGKLKVALNIWKAEERLPK
jgi:hypothetical protein